MTTAVFPATTYSSLTLLQIMEALAKDVGLPVPAAVIGSTDRTWIEALDFANRTGEELARRVDWGALMATDTLTGDGSDLDHDLPSEFLRLAKGQPITGARQMTRAEWDTLSMVEGTPRYFLLEARKVRLWPYLAGLATVSVSYVSDLWCSSGNAFADDADKTVFPSEVFIKGLIVRWRRQKGMDYADQEAEYEAVLADYADFDDGARL